MQFALILETMSPAVLHIRSFEPCFSSVSELENLYTKGLQVKQQNKMAKVNCMPYIFILNEDTNVGKFSLWLTYDSQLAFPSAGSEPKLVFQ